MFMRFVSILPPHARDNVRKFARGFGAARSEFAGGCSGRNEGEGLFLAKVMNFEMHTHAKIFSEDRNEEVI